MRSLRGPEDGKVKGRELVLLVLGYAIIFIYLVNRFILDVELEGTWLDGDWAKTTVLLVWMFGGIWLCYLASGKRGSWIPYWGAAALLVSVAVFSAVLHPEAERQKRAIAIFSRYVKDILPASKHPYVNLGGGVIQYTCDVADPRSESHPGEELCGFVDVRDGSVNDAEWGPVAEYDY